MSVHLISQKLDSIPVRREYLGWLIASFLFCLLLHLLVVLSLFWTVLGLSILIPSFLIFPATGSMGVITYFLARTFAAPENVDGTIGSFRLKGVYLVIGLLATAIGTMNLLGKQFLLGTGVGYWLAGGMILGLYSLSGLVGWNSGRWNTTIDSYQSSTLGGELRKTHRESSVWKVLERRSIKHAVVFAIALFCMSAFAGITFGFEIGFGVLTGFPAFVNVLLWLAPDAQ